MHVRQKSFVRPVRLSELSPEPNATRPSGEGVLDILRPREPRPHAGRGVFTYDAAQREIAVMVTAGVPTELVHPYESPRGHESVFSAQGLPLLRPELPPPSSSTSEGVSAMLSLNSAGAGSTSSPAISAATESASTLETRSRATSPYSSASREWSGEASAMTSKTCTQTRADAILRHLKTKCRVSGQRLQLRPSGLHVQFAGVMLRASVTSKTALNFGRFGAARKQVAMSALLHKYVFW